MMETWPALSRHGTQESDEELRKYFGEEAVITRVGRFNLIHLDHPSEEELSRRIRDFDPDRYLDPQCQLCRLLREQGGSFVYDQFH